MEFAFCTKTTLAQSLATTTYMWITPNPRAKFGTCWVLLYSLLLVEIQKKTKTPTERKACKPWSHPHTSCLWRVSPPSSFRHVFVHRCTCLDSCCNPRLCSLIILFDPLFLVHYWTEACNMICCKTYCTSYWSRNWYNKVFLSTIEIRAVTPWVWPLSWQGS